MAMKLVAAAKVRKAQDAVLQTRPFSETLQSVFGGLIKRLGSEAGDLPLLQQREIKKVTMVVISGDRGLCGSYNSYVIKKTEKRYNELIAKGIEVEMVMVGKKANSYFERRCVAQDRGYLVGVHRFLGLPFGNGRGAYFTIGFNALSNSSVSSPSTPLQSPLPYPQLLMSGLSPFLNTTTAARSPPPPRRQRSLMSSLPST